MKRLGVIGALVAVTLVATALPFLPGCVAMAPMVPAWASLLPPWEQGRSWCSPWHYLP
jgi:hypothetical protein